MMLAVAILAGGLATRLRPLTERIPKSLIEVAGKPFVFHQLDLLQKQSVTDVVFCTGFLGEMIEEAVGDGSRWDMRVQYSQDGPVLLGTGGALRRALALLGQQFLVMYGDSYLRCDFAAVQTAFQKSGRQALMTVFHNHNLFDRSNVQFRDGVIVRYDKLNVTADMHHIDWGLGAMDASLLLDYSDHQAFDLASVYQDLMKQNQLAGYEVFNRFYEIGSTAGIAETERFLVDQMEQR